MGKTAEKALQRATEKTKESTATALSVGYADQVWLRGLIQFIPYAGGPLDTWMGGPASAAQKRHVEQFMTETSAHFGKLEENVIDREFLQSEEFFLLFQEMLIRASRTYDDKKIELLSKAFSRAAISAVDSISRDSIIDIIDHLSPAHILVLRTLVANEPHAHYETTDLTGQSVGGFMHASARWIAQNHPDLADLPLEIICNDLARFDLLDYERVGSFGSQDDVIAGGARGYRPNNMGRSLIAFLDGTEPR